MSQDHESLENLLSEDRHFPPTAQFAAAANAQPDLYAHAEKMHSLISIQEQKKIV